MQAEIITIGDEILIGQTRDTNSSWIAGRLNREGIGVYQFSSVHDDPGQITRALDEACGRSDLVILTGGLGPTRDDITRETLAAYFGTHLVLDQDLLGKIGKMLAARGLALNEVNRMQACVPESCRLLHNDLGAAPGMWFEKDGRVVVSLPGVPYEMEHIMEEMVIPAVREHFSISHIEHLTVQTYGTYEARLAEMLSSFEDALPPDIRLAYLPSSGIIRLRLSSSGTNRDELRRKLLRARDDLVGFIQPYVFGYDDDSLEKIIGVLLRERKASLSAAESCTGGRIAHMITLVPGSSDYFRGSVVAYSNEMKTGLLGVPPALIREHGAVSSQVVEAMAEGARTNLGTDYALAVSGIAGPSGGSPEKPVGTVWIAVTGPAGPVSEKSIFGKHREQNIHRASLSALNMLRKYILSA